MFGYSHLMATRKQPGRAAYGAGVPAGLPSGQAPAVAMQVGRFWIGSRFQED